VTGDARRSFPATDPEYDAPDGATVDLTDLGRPGTWERHGNRWEPAATQGNRAEEK
jgi:hypothetical protein